MSFGDLLVRLVAGAPPLAIETESVPQSEPLPTYKRADQYADLHEIHERLELLPLEINDAQAEVTAIESRRAANEQAISQHLTAAEAGTLKNPELLTQALGKRSNLTDNTASLRLMVLRAEHSELTQGIQAHKQKALQKAYDDALMDYVRTIAPAAAKAQKLRDAAAAIYIQLNNQTHGTPGNCTGLIGNQIRINNAVIELSAYATA